MMVASGTEARAEEGASEEIAYNPKAFEWKPGEVKHGTSRPFSGKNAEG